MGSVVRSDVVAWGTSTKITVNSDFELSMVVKANYSKIRRMMLGAVYGQKITVISDMKSSLR